MVQLRTIACHVVFPIDTRVTCGSVANDSLPWGVPSGGLIVRTWHCKGLVMISQLHSYGRVHDDNTRYSYRVGKVVQTLQSH